MVLDQGELTQLMIMIELFDGVDKPASIAKNVGITIQGVNYHLKILRKKGLVGNTNEISKEGFSFLESGLGSLREFVSENMAKIDNIVTWEAIADTSIKKGEEVGVYMSSGYLHAGKENGKARGIARNSAGKDEIVVASISGIIGVEFGNVVICVLPSAEDIEDKEKFASTVSGEINPEAKIAVVGEEAFYAVSSAGSVPQIEYASLEGVFEAATRGLDSVLFISSRRFHYLLPQLKEMQNRYKEIGLKIKYL